jgi:hypothetical protein
VLVGAREQLLDRLALELYLGLGQLRVPYIGTAERTMPSG